MTKKGQSIFNPFSGLSNKKREKDEREERRSFKPEELSEYLNNIINIKHEEVKLIGLLMIYTGCRTSEAAGL
jgi:integrase